MGYSVKVKIAPNMSIEVSGDDIETVAMLLNETTRKFFPASPASKIQI
jgi:hypothetical protein